MEIVQIDTATSRQNVVSKYEHASSAQGTDININPARPLLGKGNGEKVTRNRMYLVTFRLCNFQHVK